MRRQEEAGRRREEEKMTVVEGGCASATFFTWQTCCQTLPPPAIAWFAEPQAEERRECEPRSGSKPSVTAASGSCRLKSAAAIDAEDVPVAHHANESSRLRSAGVC